MQESPCYIQNCTKSKGLVNMVLELKEDQLRLLNLLKSGDRAFLKKLKPYKRKVKISPGEVVMVKRSLSDGCSIEHTMNVLGLSRYIVTNTRNGKYDRLLWDTK